MQNVIHSGKNHQHYDDCKADPEPNLLSTFRQRSPAYRLDRVEQKVSPIEQRHRKQVQQADGDGNHADEVEQGAPSQFGNLSRYPGDPDRTTDLVGGLAPDE